MLNNAVVSLYANSVNLGALAWAGGQGVLVGVASAWNSATATLQFLGPDGATYITTSVTLSANGVSTVFTLPPGKIQLTVSGGTPTAGYISAYIVPTNVN